jgi:hypothetical protein
MAVNFQLLDKQTGEAVSLSHVDDMICKDVYNCTPHIRHYGGNVFNWYDTIGFQIAYGMKLDDGEGSVREYYQNSELWADEYQIIDSVISYLQEHYTTKSWASGYGR